MGYHQAEIQKGEYGFFSKIEEEFQELKDAHTQSNPVMELVEISDLLGAIQGYLEKKYLNVIKLEDLLKMTAATRSAFESGDRK